MREGASAAGPGRRQQGRRSPAGHPTGDAGPGDRGPGDRAARPELRDAILGATRDLLAHTQFSDLSVADILTAAGVSRGSFYFYFDSKHAVLAELVRQAVRRGHEAAAPWLSGPQDSTAALRAGITDGAHLWQENAAVLRAIVENWRTDSRLSGLWLKQMQTFTDAAVAQIAADQRAAGRLAGLDITAVAGSLTWLGERLYYLAASGIPPFDNEATLIETMLAIWTSTLYGEIPGPPGPGHPPGAAPSGHCHSGTSRSGCS
jgi:TetR/AcrR family transcriptional regulator, ethionamide resistance regulator